MSVNRNIFGAIGARGILFIENLFWRKACVGAQSQWDPVQHLLSMPASRPSNDRASRGRKTAEEIPILPKFDSVYRSADGIGQP
jgi:hypothetical protein